jgi:uncharacterized protein YrrD
MTDNQSSTDIGAPVSYLVLKNGTPVFDRAGNKAGQVEHVLADEGSDVFHGLIVETGRHGHRFAPAAKVDGLFEHGVIIAVAGSELPEPSADPSARQAEQDAGLGQQLKKAWEWLKQPK